VFSLRDLLFGLQDDIADVLETTFNSRWEMVFSNLHYVRALLNLYIRDHPRLNIDGTTLHALYHVIHKLEDVLGVHFDDVLAKLMEYKESSRPYNLAKSPNIHLTNMLLHQW